MPAKHHANTGRAARNPRTCGSAAAFAGCIGLPAPGAYERGQGSLREWCTREFLPAFDRLAEHRMPELRASARDDRYFRQL